MISLVAVYKRIPLIREAPQEMAGKARTAHDLPIQDSSLFYTTTLRVITRSNIAHGERRKYETWCCWDFHWNTSGVVCNWTVYLVYMRMVPVPESNAC